MCSSLCFNLEIHAIQSHQVDLLTHRWRYPTVSIHGIEGAFSSSGSKTVIPAKVIAKFSIRQVPNMDPAMVEKQVKEDKSHFKM